MDGRNVWVLLALVACLVTPCRAQADQNFLVTEYACHPIKGIFVLTTHAFDSEDGKTDTTPGFHKMAYGVSHISCSLGAHKLRASIDVSDDCCQGGVAAGDTTVRRISIDGVNLFDYQPHFYWLTGDRPLLEIRFKIIPEGVLIDKCTATDPVYGNVGRPDSTCDSTVRKLK